jgi:spore coat polysaccharide biosynthesis predicted glycosyltransferase SpsG
VINSELGLHRGSYEARKSLLGEAYAPIGKSFVEAKPYSFPQSPNRQPVFVMMGATDPRGATFDALEALREIRQCEFALIVFSGDGSRKEEILSY